MKKQLKNCLKSAFLEQKFDFFFSFNNCICNYFNRCESEQQQSCRIAQALLRENICFEKLC